MKMNMLKIKCSLAVVLRSIVIWPLMVAAEANSQVLYSEDFTRSNTGGNDAVSTLGWNAYSDSTATDISTGNTLVAITPAAGNPSSSFGALYAAPSSTNQIFSAVEALGMGSSISLTGGESITWTMGNGNTTASVRILIQLGGDGSVGSGTWYASNTAFSNSTSYASFSAFSGASTATVSQSLVFSTQASSWRNFSLAPNSSMLLGGVLSSDLASSTITGIGFYMQATTSGQNIRLDTLSVAAVPEPATVSLLLFFGIGLGVIALLRGKKRNME